MEHLEDRVLSRRIAGRMVPFLVLATACTVAAPADDALTAAMDDAADRLASQLNAVAQAEVQTQPLDVAVRPARMALGNIYVHCRALSIDLRDMLRARLEDQQRRWSLDFRVRATDADEAAVSEVNTGWRHDVRGDADVMLAVVRVRVRGEIVRDSEMHLTYVDATDLTREQRACLMRWTHDERLATVADGQLVTAWEEPSVGSLRLRKYAAGDDVEIYGDMVQIGTGESWQLVGVEDQYGFAKVAGSRPAGKSGKRQRGRYPKSASSEDQLHGCGWCPELVEIPAGQFLMGDLKGVGEADENPRRSVYVARFALARHETTVEQFRRFAKATNYRTEAETDRRHGCRTLEYTLNKLSVTSGSWPWEWGWTLGQSWRNLEYAIEDDQPVVCVSWNDAQEYIRWLNKETSGGWRLPSEAEWEYAVRAGRTTLYHFGDNASHLCKYGNVADTTKLPDGSNIPNRADCADGAVYPTRVRSYLANDWELYDMHGNVWEWTEDCSNDSYEGAPKDASAWQSGDCSRRILRGGSWFSEPSHLRAAYRYRTDTDDRISNIGFRVARTLAP